MSRNIQRRVAVSRGVMSCLRGFRALFDANPRLHATALVLVLAYVGLAGEAIHCQYFPSEHNQHAEHSTIPTPATDHATHCLVANHAGSATVNAHESEPLPALAPTVRLLPDESLSLVSRLVRLTPVRAPPLS
jgi:hypothetical protein